MRSFDFDAACVRRGTRADAAAAPPAASNARRDNLDLRGRRRLFERDGRPWPRRTAAQRGADVRVRVDRRFAEADTALARSETASDEFTAKLADVTARRHALDTAVREHASRIVRLTDEIAAVVKKNTVGFRSRMP